MTEQRYWDTTTGEGSNLLDRFRLDGRVGVTVVAGMIREAPKLVPCVYRSGTRRPSIS